jgi:flavodoxin
MNEILVAYYSRSGKTKAVAVHLARMLGADLEEITEAAHRSGAKGWLLAGRDTMFDRPATLTSSHDLSGRKVIVLGMPVWAFAPPPAIRAFIRQHDLAGKSVIAFATMDGSGGERTLESLAKMLPGGLACRLVLKKPRGDDPVLLAQLQEFAERIRSAKTA